MLGKQSLQGTKVEKDFKVLRLFTNLLFRNSFDAKYFDASDFSLPFLNEGA